MIEWDVKIGDPIEYFDPSLSYEITKYRPINKTEGLDFNPDWFREDAINKMNTGKYSNTIYGTRSYMEFWKERYKRSIEGYEINGYRITGDNYFFLNFYRLKTSIEGAKASAGRTVSFPIFLVFQYEFFHYIEMCEILGKDVGLVKARALGISEIGANLCARPFVTTPNYRVLISAFSEKLLSPTMTKIWSQLDWLNMETEGAFKRVRMAVNTRLHKRASVKQKDGSEFGHMSEIEGAVADSPEKIRGDRVERLLYEEAGSDKIFKEKYTQGEALITVLGGQRVGTRIAWGTGGDREGLGGLKDLVLEPVAHNVLPYKHNHTEDGRYVLTAMFMPAYIMVAHLLDHRGWTDPAKGKEWYEEERAKKASDPKGLLMYQAEYCFTIEEAFSQEGDNIFPREELAEQLTRLEVYKEVPKPVPGNLIWTFDSEDNVSGVKWIPSPEGRILISEPPLLSDEGTEYRNLYVGGIDSIDIGTKDSTGTDKNPSDFCIVIKKRILGTSQPKYVAMYKERPRDIREAYEIAAKLLIYYNAQAVLESSRTAIITHFRNSGWGNLLMKRPRATMSSTRGNTTMVGAPATVRTIEHYLELVYDFILDNWNTIEFKEMLEQLLSYSYDRKKDYDIVAALGMAELGDEELTVKRPTAKEPPGKQFQDVGWWVNEYGYRQYGVIPKTEEERNERTRIRKSDSWLYEGNI